MIDSTKSSKAKFLEIYNVSDLKQLSEDQYDRAVKQLQAKKQKQIK
jgi:hypothetical protein